MLDEAKQGIVRPTAPASERLITPQTAPRPRDRSREPYERLCELIVKGRLAPGTRITELDIAGQFGVSRTPTRAALQRLREQGYVVASGSGKRSRIVVAPMSNDDARELYGIVGELEGLAARWVAQLSYQVRIQVAGELKRLNDGIARLAPMKAEHANRMFTLDMDFHRCFVQAAGAPRLLALHDATSAQRERYVRLYASTLVHNVEAPVAEHARIIEAIRRGTPERAQRAVQAHYLHAVERLTSVIAAIGELGSW